MHNAWHTLRQLWRPSPARPTSPPTPPAAPDTSFMARLAAEWRRQWDRPQPTRDQLDAVREAHEAAVRRAQEAALIRQIVAGHGVLWRGESGGPTLPGWGRMISFDEWSRRTVLDD